jgi:NADH:ubiquinone oxidoreductase subunit 5 (subunit L)/multisubunit Na+/H+ antiporter MnhA subunit
MMPVGTLLLGAPLAVLTALIIFWWCGHRPAESTITRLSAAGFVSAAAVAALLLAQVGDAGTSASAGVWFNMGDYHFPLLAAVDPLALTLVCLASVLLAIIAVFSSDYLHQESGFLRFYLLMTLFGAGVLVIGVAGTLDAVFFGWELVGVSSALLIAFFSHRTGPARNGLRAFLTYRVCDTGLLAAIVWLHRTVGSTSIDVATGPWLGLRAPSSSFEATVGVLLLLFACMGKSALAPFGGWLPRAMEGPTPSSAVFYGALSVHLGPYLLLRCWPLLQASPMGATAVFLVGLATALHGTLVGRVQSDVKSALAYASMTQVGLILIEISLGLYWFAVAHMVGHACLRTAEILRAPSVLHDYHHLEQSLGEVLPRMGVHYERFLPRGLQLWLYRNALERGFFEALLLHLIHLWRRLALALDRLERGVEGLFLSSELENEP